MNRPSDETMERFRRDHEEVSNGHKRSSPGDAMMYMTARMLGYSCEDAQWGYDGFRDKCRIGSKNGRGEPFTPWLVETFVEYMGDNYEKEAK